MSLLPLAYQEITNLLEDEMFLFVEVEGDHEALVSQSEKELPRDEFPTRKTGTYIRCRDGGPVHADADKEG